MPKQTNYSKIYRRYSSNPQLIMDPLAKMVRGQFYQILEYKYVEEEALLIIVSGRGKTP